MCGAWWSFMKMPHLFFKHAFGLLFPFTVIFMPWNTKIQPPTFKCNVSIYPCKTMISTFWIIFVKKKTVLLCILGDYVQFFFFKSNIWGEVVAYICLQRGGRSWGEMSTLSLWINPLGRSSKEHLHVSTSRKDKGGRSLTVRVACPRAAAEVSLVLTLSLSWECTFRGHPHQVTVVSEQTHCDVLHFSLRAPESNGLANVSACNGGCQHHLRSIDPAPTWGQTIRERLW